MVRMWWGDFPDLELPIVSLVLITHTYLLIRKFIKIHHEQRAKQYSGWDYFWQLGMCYIWRITHKKFFLKKDRLVIFLEETWPWMLLLQALNLWDAMRKPIFHNRYTSAMLLILSSTLFHFLVFVLKVLFMSLLYCPCFYLNFWNYEIQL